MSRPLMETTAAYLFGGAPTFKARRDLYTKVQQLLSSTGILTRPLISVRPPAVAPAREQRAEP